MSTAACTFEPFLRLCSVVAAPRAALREWSVSVRESRMAAVGSERSALRKPQQYAQIVDHLLEDARLEPPPASAGRRPPTAAGRGACSATAEPVRTIHLSPLKTSRRSWSRCGASSRTSARYGATKRPLFVGNVAWVWFSESPCPDAIVSELKFSPAA